MFGINQPSKVMLYVSTLCGCQMETAFGNHAQLISCSLAISQVTSFVCAYCYFFHWNMNSPSKHISQSLQPGMQGMKCVRCFNIKGPSVKPLGIVKKSYHELDDIIAVPLSVWKHTHALFLINSATAHSSPHIKSQQVC